MLESELEFLLRLKNRKNLLSVDLNFVAVDCCVVKPRCDMIGIIVIALSVEVAWRLRQKEDGDPRQDDEEDLKSDGHSPDRCRVWMLFNLRFCQNTHA